MGRRVVTLDVANRDQWIREVRFTLALTSGPVLVAGVLTLLFIEAHPWLAGLASLSRVVASKIFFGGVFLVNVRLAGTLFHDDFGEGLPRLMRSVALAETTTVIVPITTAAASIWAVALAHPAVAASLVTPQTLTRFGMILGGAEAVVLVVTWGVGRVLRL